MHIIEIINNMYEIQIENYFGIFDMNIYNLIKMLSYY